MSSFSNPFRAFSSYDFRLYFAGQFVSLAGTWMQQIAMSWLIFRLTNSELMLGLLAFSSQVPILLFGLVGGVWSDRIDRRRLMLITQSLSMLQALILVLLAWLELLTPGLLLLLAFLMGSINAFDIPARQSLVIHLVKDRAHLPNAIALNSIMMNGSRFLGPALAGFLVAWAGELVCFAINALSYVAVILALLLMRVRPKAQSKSGGLAALREGLEYTLSHLDIRCFLILVALVSFSIAPYISLMPKVAKGLFGGDASTFGILVSSAGSGALLAAAFLALRKDIDQLPRQVFIAASTAGLGLIGFALNPWYWLAFPLLMTIGFSVVLVAAGSNTLIQSWVQDEMRGRVMSLFTMAFLGMAPMGSLVVGSLAEAFGVRPVLSLCGLVTLTGVWWLGRRFRFLRAWQSSHP